MANVQFYRQKPIGPYIVDFYAPRAKLVVEVDGAQHREGEHTSQDTALVVEEIYRWVVGFGNPP